MNKIEQKNGLCFVVPVMWISYSDLHLSERKFNESEIQHYARYRETDCYRQNFVSSETWIWLIFSPIKVYFMTKDSS